MKPFRLHRWTTHSGHCVHIEVDAGTEEDVSVGACCTCHATHLLKHWDSACEVTAEKCSTAKVSSGLLYMLASLGARATWQVIARRRLLCGLCDQPKNVAAAIRNYKPDNCLGCGDSLRT